MTAETLIWLDFFVKTFLGALAWCLAVLSALVIAAALVQGWYLIRPLPRRRRRGPVHIGRGG